MARIAFIAPSLKAKDGIGDYTRRLGTECVRMGHSVQIHALNEIYSSELISEVIPVEGKTIEVYRWGKEMDCALKCHQSRERLEAFAPDWISLQFEFYCFSDKGFLGDFARLLPALLSGFHVHLNMHELWTPLVPEKGWRERLKAPVRYWQYASLIRKISPTRKN
jgi:hypothetical protein